MIFGFDARHSAFSDYAIRREHADADMMISLLTGFLAKRLRLQLTSHTMKLQTRRQASDAISPACLYRGRPLIEATYFATRRADIASYHANIRHATHATAAMTMLDVLLPLPRDGGQ